MPDSFGFLRVRDMFSISVLPLAAAGLPGLSLKIRAQALAVNAYDSLSIRSAARLADLVAASIPQFKLSAYAPAK